MRSTTLIICSLFICLLNLNSYAQDKIITKDRDTLDAKVITISEKITSYKLTSYLEGPEYQLSNQRISKILFANGEEFQFDNGSPQGTPLFDEYKNSLEFMPTELVFARFGLGYSRFIGKNFEVKLEGATNFMNRPNSGISNFSNFAGLQINYHPISFRRVDYYVGARFRIGNVRYYRYNNNYYNIYGNEPSIANAVVSTIGVINGLRINFTQRFALNLGFSMEVLLEEGYGATQTLPALSFGVCYKF